MTTTEPTEIDALVLKAQSGSRNAFALIVEQHYELVLRVARNMTPGESDAEDVTQMAFVKLGKSIHQFRFESAFSTWLYRLVINCAHDWRKSRDRHLAAIDDSADVEAGHTDDAQQHEQTNHADTGVRLKEVLAHIEQMGLDYLETVTLVIGEGLTHGQAAETLGVKESTVSWRLHEIRKQLSEH